MRRRTFTKYIIGSVLVGGVFGGLLIAVMHFINSPVVGKSTLSGAEASAAPKPRQPNQLSGLNFLLDYPGVYDQVGSIKTDAQALEQYNLGSKSNYRRIIAISVRPLPSNSLTEDSSYRLRENASTVYRPVQDKIGTEPVVRMIKNDHTEVTLFWAHKAKVITIALTSTDPNDNVDEQMAFIQPTIRWR